MEIFLHAIVLILVFYLLARIVDEVFIQSLDVIAKQFKLPSDVAGATLMAMGTSAPELATALFALFLVGSSPALGVGTIVGSAIFQILVVVGFAALVKTSYLNWKPVVRDTLFYLISVIMLLFVLADGVITLADSLILVGGYIVYLLVILWWSRKFPEPDKDPVEIVEQEMVKQRIKLFDSILTIKEILFWPFDKLFSLIPSAGKRPALAYPLFAFCLAAIAFLSYLLVNSAQVVATGLGVSPAIIGLTILAGGTSIPELISSAIVARQGRGDMAISNAIGSNIFDIQISLGLPLLIFTLVNGNLAVTESENITSSVILLFVTLVMVLALLISQKFKVSKPFGLFLIFLYVLYVIAAYSGLL